MARRHHSEPFLEHAHLSDVEIERVQSNTSALSNQLSTFSVSPAPSTSENTEDTWGTSGLTVLYSPPEPLVDFIFVHGLRGGSRKTWCKDDNPELFWPKEWLPQDPDLQSVRISTFGYNANWLNSKGTFLDVHHFGRDLFSSMFTLPSLRRSHTPIVLIGHSMGGLVIKKAFLLAREDPRNNELAERIQCIFFLATPHRGSNFAALLNNILKATMFLPTRAYIADLEQNSPAIQKMAEEFIVAARQLQIWSFYESLKTRISRLHSLLIVQPSSAILGTKNERAQPLNANHRDVCKYKSKSDPNFMAVRNALVAAVEELIEDVIKIEENQRNHELKTLASFLNISDNIDDFMADLEEMKTPGSCEWAVEEPRFQDWRDTKEMGVQIYYLTGAPGTGKSILATHIIRHLQDIGSDCCFYFFAHGRKSQQTVATCLRNLTYQLALLHPEIRTCLDHLRTRGLIFDKDDERSIWQKILVSELFKIDLQRVQYWVLDGLDECIDSAKLVSFLTNLRSRFPVRIFITSRKHPSLQKLFARLSTGLTTNSVDSENTKGDIELYLTNNSDLLPVDQRDHQKALMESIVSKSAGCFLWAKLVLEQLDFVDSQEDVESVLEDLPVEMMALYKRILDYMLENARDTALVRSILSWAVCGARRLSVDELRYALKLDVKLTILNVERTVETNCGQLLRIDRQKAVQVIHNSARDFLLDEKLDSVFALKREQCHTRLALVCLEYLNGPDMSPPRSQTLINQRHQTGLVFADYACTSFAEHLSSASPKSEEVFHEFDQFLRTNVLAWMDYIALHKRNLYYFTRASKHINTYLQRRSKITSPMSQAHSNMAKWATDILRVAAKFGRNLLEYPASIHFLIPPLCPRDTGIYHQFSSSSNELQLVGLANPSWEDCISHVEFRESRATSLAGGDNMLAIGMRSGAISICAQSTGQETLALQHDEPVKVLKFDPDNQHLASIGTKTIKMWELTGKLLWTNDLRGRAVACHFAADNQAFHVANSSSEVVTFQSSSGVQLSMQRYVNTGKSRSAASQSPLCVAVSPNDTLLAIGYRGRPIQVWTLKTCELIGECGGGKGSAGVRDTSVQEMLFNPNPAVELLAVTHQEGTLILYDPVTQKELKVVETEAYVLASTVDGRTLATGDMMGTIQLWDFETLTLLYRIVSFEYEVKSLAFSNDGFRLFDIRQTEVTIWEPSALVRKSISDDSSSSDTLVAHQLTDNPERDFVEITAVWPATSTLILVGKDDGAVHAYTSVTGKDHGRLYSHTRDVIVAHLAWSKSGIIASADVSGRVCVYQVSSESKNWVVQDSLLDRTVGTGITSIDISADGTYLLVHHQQTLSIFDLSNEGAQLALPKQFGPPDVLSWRWSNNSTELMALTKDAISVCSMMQAETEFPVTFRVAFEFSAHSELRKSSALSFMRSIASNTIVVELEDEIDAKAPKYIFLAVTPSTQTQPGDTERPPEFTLERVLMAHLARFFLGFHDERIVFLDHKLWVQSIEFGASKDRGWTVSKHCFIPYELIGGNNGVSGCVTIAGDLVFPKQGELAIIQNGLKWAIH